MKITEMLFNHVYPQLVDEFYDAWSSGETTIRMYSMLEGKAMLLMEMLDGGTGDGDAEVHELYLTIENACKFERYSLLDEVDKAHYNMKLIAAYFTAINTTAYPVPEWCIEWVEDNVNK